MKHAAIYSGAAMMGRMVSFIMLPFYAKHTGVVAKLRSWTSAAKIVLAWFFISTWGNYGAAFSASIIGLVTAVLGYILAQRRYAIRIEWGKVTLITGLAVSMFLVLVNWDLQGSSMYLWLKDQAFPWINGITASSFLGTWKDGKVQEILVNRNAPLSDMVIKGGLAATFAILLPFIHEPTRLRMRRLAGNSIASLMGMIR